MVKIKSLRSFLYDGVLNDRFFLVLWSNLNLWAIFHKLLVFYSNNNLVDSFLLRTIKKKKSFDTDVNL